MKAFLVDLTKIEGEGDFPCQECGTIISPGDETENAYKIIDAKVKKDTLKEITIECAKCKKKTKIVGFLLIQK